MPQEPREIFDVSQLLWPDPAEGPWYVGLTWAEVDGRIECVGADVWHGARPVWRVADDSRAGLLPVGNGPAPLLASEVRSLPLASIIGKERARLAEQWRGVREAREHMRSIEMRRPAPEETEAVDALHGRYLELLDAALTKIGQPKAGVGRPRELGPEQLAEVAAVYLEAWERGDPPTKAVAEHFHISSTAAAKRVAKCREAGLIEKTAKGKPSGVPRSAGRVKSSK